MKILHVVAGYPSRPGFGVARYAAESARAIADLGHVCHLASTSAMENGRSSERDGVVEYGLEPVYPFGAYNEYLQAALEDIPLTGRLAEIWKDAGPFDLVLAHDWAAGMAASVLQRAYHCPLVGMVHGTEVGRAGGKVTREQHYVADMERWFCERSDRIVIPSGHVRGEVEKHYRADARKVTVVSGGAGADLFEAEVDVEEFRGMFAETDEKLLLFSGRLESFKGPDNLIEAFRILAGSFPRIRLAVAGEGSLQQSLVEQVNRFGLEAKVRFTGTLGPSVMGALFQVSDLLVMPSRSEAFGIAALEALLYDLPVVAFPAGGLPELAKATGRIDLATQDSVQSLSECITASLRKSGETRKRRPPQDELIPARYRWKAVAKSLVKVFESLFVPASR